MNVSRRGAAFRRMNRCISHLIAGWRTGLSRSVLILQAGDALNYFGYGLVLPFEIIYLHQIRGFSTSTAGLVLAATMGTSAIVTPPTGALLDRYSAKAFVVAGSAASTVGYAGFAFVDRPWQAFACSIASGAGLGAAGTANRTLFIRLVTPEQRAAAFALNRVAGNFGIGAGSTVAGFIVASAAQRLSSFQILYFFDAVTFAGFALIVLAAVPNPRAVTVTATDANGTGFRAVARDRLFLTVIAANIVLVVVGHTFFSNILSPFAKAHTPVGPAAIGIIFLVNTSFIVIAQIPAVRVVARMRRTHGFRGGERALCDCAPRGLAGDAHPLGARCGQSSRRRCDRLRNRRMRTHSRSRAAGLGHGPSPSARPLPVSLQSDLHPFPSPWPGDRWPSPTDLARRHLVGRRACRGAGRSRPASTRRPHPRPTPRSTVTSCIGARGRVRSCQEKVMGVCAGVLVGLGLAINGPRQCGQREDRATVCATVGYAHEHVVGRIPCRGSAGFVRSRTKKRLNHAGSKRVWSGGGGIRTHGRVAPSTVFKTVPFDRSGTPPRPQCRQPRGASYVPTTVTTRRAELPPPTLRSIVAT